MTAAAAPVRGGAGVSGGLDFLKFDRPDNTPHRGPVEDERNRDFPPTIVAARPDEVKECAELNSRRTQKHDSVAVSLHKACRLRGP